MTATRIVEVDTTARAAALASLRHVRAGRRRRHTVGCIVLAVLLVGVFIVALCVGDRIYSPVDVIRVVLGDQVAGASFTVGRLRLPRAIIAVLVGASFGLGGIVFQTLLRNGLAAPDIIGVTSGASASAVFGILVLGWAGTPVSILAVIGGVLVSMGIFAAAYNHGLSTTRLVLIGIAVAAMFTGLISYMLLRGNMYDVQSAMRWLTGSLDGAFWGDVPGLALSFVVLAPLLAILASRLRVLQLGDLTATALGVRVNATRLGIIVVAVCLISVATSVTGPIAFVAFLAGPIAVRIIGSTAALVPSALVGALLVLVGDFVGSHLLPIAYPVGTVTGVVGGVYLLVLLARSTRSGGFL